MDKIKSGATVALNNLAWFGSVLKTRAAEMQANLETNPQYQQTMSGISQTVTQVRGSDAALRVHKTSVATATAIAGAGERVATGTVSLVATVKEVS